MQSVKNISVKELHQKILAGEQFYLIDVREQFERDICNIGGEMMNFTEIINNLDKIPRDIPVILYCHFGERSYLITQILTESANFDNIWNLKEGINAWATEIDTSMTRY
jgi:adenylyltransferase/sulfurtransferase